ncbi:MAG: hypothetical protein IJE57_03360, partial [Anaerotignum sp.]|nr:hypothetical protein [Anaerotignum sp.]
MKKRLFSIFISLTMVTGLFPVTVAFAAEEEGFNSQKYEEKVGISSVPTQTYDELGFNTGYTDLEKQANDPYSPYGKGVTNLVTQHEIFAVSGDASENFDPYIVENKSDILMPEDADDFKLTYPLNLGPYVIAQRSVAFDPNGTGKPDHIASVYLADAGNNATIMYIAYGNTQWTKTELLNGLPFEVLPEQAGAYLSIAAGNFDGDDKGTEEIAFYRPNYNFGNQT